MVDHDHRNPNKDIMVQDSPAECISCLKFCPSSNIFAVTSWNNKVTLYKYDNKSKTKIISTNQHNLAALCCNWDSSGKYLFSGGCDNTVNVWQINGYFKPLIQHHKTVQCIEYSKSYNLLISGSWDRTIKYSDIRCNTTFKTVNMNGKIHAMSHKGNALVVGLSNKIIQEYDVRKCTQCIREMTEEYGTVRDIEIFPDKKGYVMVSCEGKGFVKYFNSVGNFSWKCHRQNIVGSSNGSDVYSANTIRFHKEYKSFVTGGDDGRISVWDKDNKERLKQFEPIARTASANPFYPMPITSIDFDRTGTIMGYCTGYNWNMGLESIYYKEVYFSKPQIYLHKMIVTNFKA